MIRHRLLKSGLTVLVFLGVAAGAWAYWGASGSGSGSASSANAQAVTVSVASPASELYPGGSADVALSVSNPNAFQVSIPSLALDTSQGTNGLDVDAAHSGCDVSTLAFTPQSNSGGGWKVPPKVGSADGSLGLDLADAVSMSGSAANACQGATFTVHLKVGS
jgi:hypothetical protein